MRFKNETKQQHQIRHFIPLVDAGQAINSQPSRCFPLSYVIIAVKRETDSRKRVIQETYRNT